MPPRAAQVHYHTALESLHLEPTQMVKSDDTGKFILRVSLGVLILLHGIAKLQGGVGFI